MKPPHLPPKTDNPETKKFLQRLKWFLFILVISLIAGMSGASMMLGWIWPKFSEDDAWMTSYTRSGLSRAQLEGIIRDEISARLVGVYRGSVSLAGVSYLNKKIGDGVMVSSDGWLALYQPTYDGSYKAISVVVNDGTVYSPENAVWDKYSGVLYIKIKNDQFKVAEFADEDNSLDDIFVWQDANWYHGTVLYPLMHSKISHLDSAPMEVYSLSGAFVSGGVAINSQGRVVGLIAQENVLLPAVFITRVLPDVLSKQSIAYPSLGVEGWFDDEQIIVADSDEKKAGKERVKGFFVSNVIGVNNTFRKGDIIQEINGRIVSFNDLWYTISNAQTVKVKIIRAKKILELDAQVVQIK